MEQICYDILEAWAKYSNFDPNRTQFNLLSYEYNYHKATKKIEKLVTEYDKSGVLAVLTIKHLFLQVMKDAHITVYDAMTKPQALQEHIDMLNLFQCKEILDAEKHYTDKLKLLISKILGTQLIESSDKTDADTFNEKIIACTDSVIQNLEKCHDEVYMKSGNPIGIIDNFSTKILTFPTLAECILALNKADDGIYLCYIDANQTSDGYFGFFIKSNGNLLSVNERISENFRGQHANARNGRWAEDKAVGIFPYDFIFSYGERDYKGYAWNYNIDDTKLSLSLLEEDAYLPLLIAMVFVAGRLSEKNLDEYEVTYTENLLSINMPLLTKDANELMVLTNNDLVVATNSLNLSFDYDKIMDGTVFDEFKNTKFLYSDNHGQIFVDLYGAGFQPQPTLNVQKYLTDKNVNHVNELVATAPKMRAYALMDIRTQLVAYIKDKMHEEFVNFGGFDAIYKWFTEVINSNIEKIKKLAIEEYVNVKTLRKGGRCTASIIVKSGTYGVDLREDDKNFDAYLSYMVNQWDRQKNAYIDLDLGTKCSIFIKIFPSDYKTFENIFGIEVPKILKGWATHRDGYSCNPLLQGHDDVEGMRTPTERYAKNDHKDYERKDWNHDKLETMSFGIGFSKRGFAAAAKKYEIDINNLAPAPENERDKSGITVSVR